MVAASPPLPQMSCFVFEHGQMGSSGCRVTCHSSTSIKVRALVAGGTEGRAEIGASRPTRSNAGAARSTACKIMDGLSLANGLRGQPHAKRPLNTHGEFRSAQTVDPQIPLDPAGCVDVDELRTLRMRLAGQTRDDRDHVTFAQSLICRGIGLIHRHGSKNRKSVQQRFDDDQAAPLRCSVSCRGACYPAKQSLSSDPKLMSHYQMPGAAHPPLGDRRQRSCYAAPFAAASIHWRTIEYSGGFSTMIWRRRSEISPVAPSRASQPPSRSSPPPRLAES